MLFVVSVTFEGVSPFFSSSPIGPLETLHVIEQLRRAPGVRAVVIQDDHRRIVATTTPSEELHWNTNVISEARDHLMAVARE